MYNPDGPDEEHPFESTSHPRVIEVRSPAADFPWVDLQAGPRARMRSVKVRVHDPDGAPEMDAVITVTAASGWKRWKPARYSGVEFSAPVSHDLTITVRDHVFHHGPGSTPIEQTVVIQP